MNDLLLSWALPALPLLLAALAVVAGALWWRARQRRLARLAAERDALLRQQEQERQRSALQAAEHAAQQAAQLMRDAARRAADDAARAEDHRRQAAAEAQRRADALDAERAAQRAAAQAQAVERAAEQAAAQAAAAARAIGERAAALAAAAVVKPAAPHPPAAPLVMVADDSKVVRVKTSRLLAQHGYRVVLAEDGDQAAALLETELPLVLVTDVEMPGLDGFALTRHVRQQPRMAHIPIVMITSADDRLKAAAADAGVTLVLGKPYADEALLACIEQARQQAAAAVA